MQSISVLVYSLPRVRNSPSLSLLDLGRILGSQNQQCWRQRGEGSRRAHSLLGWEGRRVEKMLSWQVPLAS